MAEKVKPHRVPMPEQPPEQRIANFGEVPLGYTLEEAQREASRCLQCAKPPCISGCPVNVHIPSFIALVAEGKMAEAATRLKVDTCLPAVCGRVCPQESQCEAKCVLAKRFESVGIGRLERFVADYSREQGFVPAALERKATGFHVAVVGSGPAGLTVAGELVRHGHAVTLFEAFHKAGGVLMYGIPEFRLPKDIVAHEVAELEALGVKIELNQVIGRSITIDELLAEEGFDAVFVGVGAGLPRFMGVDGENLGGVYAANEYLTRANLMKAYDFPNYDTPIVQGEHVCVIGGGNVAMDAARTARRIGAKSVSVLYRRSREELPARAEELHHAEQEGIRFEWLCTPIRYEGDERGLVRRAICQRMGLGEPDASGRRRPEPIAGSDFEVPTDLVIVAIGSSANPLLTSTAKDIALNRYGNIVTNDEGRTSRHNVWAGGDIVTGAATVILAMGAGKRAAADIHRYLSELPARS
jgi:glutamate synthase (NADPH/NADH) small chain